MTGTRITHLGSDMWMKLKAAYTLIEQLYSGSQRAICRGAYNKPPPMLIKETLEKLSMLSARLDELKRATAKIRCTDRANLGQGVDSRSGTGRYHQRLSWCEGGRFRFQ